MTESQQQPLSPEHVAELQKQLGPRSGGTGLPTGYLLAGLSFSAWEAVAVFLVVVAPIALWITVLATIPAALIIGLTVMMALRCRRDATVSNADEIARGTYYSGTTYQDVVPPQAHGWDLDRSLDSGPGSVMEIKSSLDDVDGSFTLHGREYAGVILVILANPRRPSQALASSFPSDLKPDANGNLPAKLAIRTMIGIGFTILMYAALLFAAGFSMFQVRFLGHSSGVGS